MQACSLTALKRAVIGGVLDSNRLGSGPAALVHVIFAYPKNGNRHVSCQCLRRWASAAASSATARCGGHCGRCAMCTRPGTSTRRCFDDFLAHQPASSGLRMQWDGHQVSMGVAATSAAMRKPQAAACSAPSIAVDRQHGEAEKSISREHCHLAGRPGGCCSRGNHPQLPSVRSWKGVPEQQRQPSQRNADCLSRAATGSVALAASGSQGLQ